MAGLFRKSQTHELMLGEDPKAAKSVGFTFAYLGKIKMECENQIFSLAEHWT